MQSKWQNFSVQPLVKVADIVHLTVCSADLVRDVQTFGKMSPFVEVTAGLVPLKTFVCQDGGKQPMWETKFTLNPRKFSAEIKFVCFDSKKNEEIGECAIAAKDFVYYEQSQGSIKK